MSDTIFIDTNTLPRRHVEGGGAVTEILNEQLAGAKNVTGALRWLQAGDRFEAAPLDRHQLLYVMEGDAAIILQGTTHEVRKGMGLYLGPAEGATIAARGDGRPVQIFHLVVRKAMD